ncbi:Ran-binding 10 [Micractinium conductrix]|uniref:Ran-binding 10 n=1 Tax=Micractinium conductrix TaxID=554055 RepID=A0A2P6VEI8_9CHLO|nr:Ran-binding 10 [Micractinium conductrix]|eukprot:PSC72505.1 Ran-binding 10 [Micractinium conductrix]
MAARQQPQPSAWDASIRSSAQRYLSVDGCRVKYIGPGSEDKDAAAVRSNHPVPSDCPIFYFEVEIASRGRDGFIGIGFSTAEVELDRLPGWEPHSYGYHGDDGHAFSGRGTGRAYGPIYSTGDWIGVILNRVERTITFTKKGYDLGIAFENVTEERLYPSVGFRTPEEEIVANFGTDLAARPFRGDLAWIRAEATQRLYSSILSTSVPRGSKGQSVIGELVFGYLRHQGHWDTAAAVARDVLGGGVAVSAQEVEEMQLRRQIGKHVAAGEIDVALALVRQLAPGLLDGDPHIHFRLQCQKFAEMIKAGLVAEAIEYGRTHVVPLGVGPQGGSGVAASSGSASMAAADRELLEDATALLAYDDPSAGPTGYILLPAHRNELAATVDRALLAHSGRCAESALEAATRQASATLQELKRSGHPAAQLLDLQSLLQQGRDPQQLLLEPGGS